MTARLFLILALMLGPACAQAQTLAAARAFTTTLYANYARREPDYLGRQAPNVFAPALLALIRRDRASTAPGDAPNLDGDPICDCQDTGGMKVASIVVGPAPKGHARATVTLAFGRERRVVTLDLAPQAGRWRVADVHTADTPSLSAWLAGVLRTPG
jgi:hypothetical protein